MKTAPREFACRLAMGWKEERERGGKDDTELLLLTTRVGLPSAEMKTTTGGGLEVRSWSAIMY